MAVKRGDVVVPPDGRQVELVRVVERDGAHGAALGGLADAVAFHAGGYRQLVFHSSLCFLRAGCLAVWVSGCCGGPTRMAPTSPQHPHLQPQREGNRKGIQENKRKGNSHIRITKKRLPIRRKRRRIVNQRRRQVVARVKLVDGILAVALGVGIGTNQNL